MTTGECLSQGYRHRSRSQSQVYDDSGLFDEVNSASTAQMRRSYEAIKA